MSFLCYEALPVLGQTSPSCNFEPTPRSILSKQEQEKASETEINPKNKINCDINCVSEKKCYYFNFSHYLKLMKLPPKDFVVTSDGIIYK